MQWGTEELQNLELVIYILLPLDLTSQVLWASKRWNSTAVQCCTPFCCTINYQEFCSKLKFPAEIYLPSSKEYLPVMSMMFLWCCVYDWVGKKMKIPFHNIHWFFTYTQVFPPRSNITKNAEINSIYSFPSVFYHYPCPITMHKKINVRNQKASEPE